MKSIALILALTSACIAHAQAGCCMDGGPMAFQPIAGSAYGREGDAEIDSAPFLIPGGFQQRIVSSERDFNLYTGADWLDMNTVNETGEQAGRYLYRTHETRGHNSARIDGGSGGAVSVVDLATGMVQELVGRTNWEALDGIVWTPWQTLLVTEEIGAIMHPDPDAPQATCGLVHEIKLNRQNRMSAENVNARPMLGALAHEGIETDAQGHVYVIDEDREGSIYKFVPEKYGDLSRGQLYALKVKNGAKNGPAEWVALDMDQVQIRAHVAAAAVGATPYCRPEDIERIGEVLYVALTCEDVDDPTNKSGPGAILSVSLGSQPAARYVVAPGKNVPMEVKPGIDRYGDPSPGVTGFKHPDNLASGPNGTLWIAEDNDWSDIWVYDPNVKDANGDGYKDSVQLFASLKDKSAESTGIYFGTDPHTLFVNVQHSGTGNDKTVAITKRRD